MNASCAAEMEKEGVQGPALVLVERVTEDLALALVEGIAEKNPALAPTPNPVEGIEEETP